MSDSVLQVSADRSAAEVAASAYEVFARGGLVAFPTETVYGIGARADLADAVARLREVKGRDAQKAFTVHIADPERADDFAPSLPPVAKRLIRRSWPGPLTVIVTVDDPASTPALKGLDPGAAEAMYHENTVGLRCPSDPVAREVLRAAGGPVIAASANDAGQPPPRSAKEVKKSFSHGYDLLIDGGDAQYAKASTIVRIVGDGYELLRTGVYDERMISDMASLRILFVCSGNTCRSPMAAGLARKILAERIGCEMSELEDRGIHVESAGTGGGWGGATDHAISAMKSRGIDIADHQSTSVTAELVRRADHIFAMTAAHRAAILQVVPDAADRVQLVLPDTDVADPFGGSLDDYDRCAAEIERGVRDRLQEVSV